MRGDCKYLYEMDGDAQERPLDEALEKQQDLARDCAFRRMPDSIRTPEFRQRLDVALDKFSGWPDSDGVDECGCRGCRSRCSCCSCCDLLKRQMTTRHAMSCSELVAGGVCLLLVARCCL